MTGRRRLRIVVIAPLRFPIRRPHAGGLESAVWHEVNALRGRGHDVTLIAVTGSDFLERGSAFEMPELHWPAGAKATDHTYPVSYDRRTTPALVRALDSIAAGSDRYDVISNHCLHPLPLHRAATLGVPMVTTLHTPIEAQLVAADAGGGHAGSLFLSVSEHTRRNWASVGISSSVLPNGIDPQTWPEGPGGDGLVWFGRIVPEKAPHLAVSVARRLGLPVTIAGRIGDAAYAERSLFPLLGDGVRYVGQLSPAELADLVGHSACALATPAWAEPFGLVGPEALMCGTPAVSFAVGGVPEIVEASVGMAMAAPGDVDQMARLAELLIRRTRLDATYRASIRDSAIARFSLDARIDALERCFLVLAGNRPSVGELSVGELSA